MKFIKQFNLFEISETWHPTGKEWYNYLLKDDITKYEVRVENIELDPAKEEIFKEREIKEIYDLYLQISKTNSNSQIVFWRTDEVPNSWSKNPPKSSSTIRVNCDFRNPEGHTPPITKFSFTIRKYEDDWFVVNLMSGYKFYLCDQLDQLLDLLSKLFRITSYYIEDPINEYKEVNDREWDDYYDKYAAYVKKTYLDIADDQIFTKKEKDEIIKLIPTYYEIDNNFNDEDLLMIRITLPPPVSDRKNWNKAKVTECYIRKMSDEYYSVLATTKTTGKIARKYGIEVRTKKFIADQLDDLLQLLQDLF